MDKNFKQFSQTAVPSVPTFLQKLVALLNEEENHEYIDWNDAGTSFIVKDQSRFSKIVLPKYFKHSNFASFVRQLNMYGFRKINSISQSGLHKTNEFIEFQHYLFVRGQDFLLEHIKRKVNNKSVELSKLSSQELIKVLDDVHKIKDSHEDITGSISELRQENEDLWREVVTLRQKHNQQQRVLNKVIQFLVSLVQHNNIGTPSRKRKLPLMLEDNTRLKLPKNNTFTPINNQALVSVPTISEIKSTSPIPDAPTTHPDETLIYTDPLPAMSPNDGNNNMPVSKSPIVTSPPDSNVVQILTDSDQSAEGEIIDVDSYLNDFIKDSQAHLKTNGNSTSNDSTNEENSNNEVTEPETPVSGPALHEFLKEHAVTVSLPTVTPNTTVSPSKDLKLDIASAKNKQLLQYKRSPSKVIEPEILEERLDNVQGNINSLHTLLNSPSAGVNIDFGLIQDLFNPNSDMPDFNDYSGFQDGSLDTLPSTSGPLVPLNKEPTQTDLDELSNLL